MKIVLFTGVIMLRKISLTLFLLFSPMVYSQNIEYYFSKQASELIADYRDELNSFSRYQCQTLKAYLPEKLVFSQRQSAYFYEALENKLTIPVIASYAILPCLEKGYISTYNIKKSHLGKLKVIINEMKEIYDVIDLVYQTSRDTPTVRAGLLYLQLQKINYKSNELSDIVLNIIEN